MSDEPAKGEAPRGASAPPAAEKGGVASTSGNGNPGWIESNQGIAIAVAFVLTSIYVSPIFVIGVAAWYTDGFQEPSFLLQWFSAFMHSANATLNEYHKVLFPIMSALSVVVFKGRPDWRFLLLAFFVFFSFGTTIVVSVVFDIQSIQDALSGYSQKMDIALTKSFFSRIQETLLMYLMMLLGIGVSNTAKKQES